MYCNPTVIGRPGTDFFLMENHRSVPSITHLANGIIANNKNRVQKTLVSTRTDNGKKPVVQAYMRTEEEYENIAASIEHQLREGKKPEDIAFIAFAKSELVKMQHYLNARGIPSIMLCPELTHENSKVQGCMALYSFLNHPEDEASMLTYLNVLSNGTWFSRPQKERDMMLEEYKRYSLEFQSFPAETKYSAFIKLIEWVKNIEADEVFDVFYDSMLRHKTWSALNHYLYCFSIYGEKNTISRKLKYPGVVLTTAHSSKGLEWPCVYASITKFDNSLIREESRKEEIEEKRRLLFVVITRARDELYISSKYYSFGKMQDKNFNIFTAELYRVLGKDIELEFEDKYGKKNKKKSA